METLTSGHNQLISALEHLLTLARAYEFHDFKNTRFATPKVELVKRLGELSDRTKRGDFDNREADA